MKTRFVLTDHIGSIPAHLIRAAMSGSLVVSLLGATAASAQSIGAEQTINQSTSGVRALTWDAAMDVANGTGIVAWQTETAFSGINGADGSRAAVVARRVDGTGGPIGSEFIVNSYTTGDQAFPIVRMLTDGGFAIAWSHRVDASSAWGAKARVYDGNGDPVTSEFNVEQTTAGSQYAWDVVRHPDGEFTVVWSSYPNVPGGSSDGSVLGRRFTAAGAAAGGEFSISQGGNAPIRQPNASIGDDDGFVVVWSRGTLGSATVDIFARAFDASGTANGNEFSIDATAAAQQTIPVVETDGARALAAWREGTNGVGGTGQSVAIRELDRSGAVVGARVTIATVGTLGNSSPSIAPIGDNRFVVAWAQGEGAEGLDTQVRIVGDSTAELGPAFTVNSTTSLNQGFPYGPTVRSTGTTNEFVVAWADRSRGAGGDDIITSVVDCTGDACLEGERPCGDPVPEATVSAPAGLVTASDALFILNVAVGLLSCLDCVCDVNGSGSVTATDALSALNLAVGIDTPAACPAC